MYYEDLLSEVSSALSDNSDLDYDVASMVAEIYITIRRKQADEDTRKYHLYRKRYITKKFRHANGICFRKEKVGHPQVPTSIVLMKKFPFKDNDNFTTAINGYEYIFTYMSIPRGFRWKYAYKVAAAAMGVQDLYSTEVTIRQKLDDIKILPKYFIFSIIVDWLERMVW